MQNIIHWYFSKSALPYWCLFLLDMGLVVFSCLLTYWLFYRTGEMFTERFEVLYTSLAYALLSGVGAKIFHTYSGVVRYSSFVDLIRLVYANGVSMVLALILSWVAEAYHIVPLSALHQSQTVMAFIVATSLMAGMRVIVKTLYDVTSSNRRAMRVLIYGAMSGGIGVAKNIGSQHPRRFELRGFITHDSKASNYRLMGLRVYSLTDDLCAIVRKEHIRAVLVSPLRIEDFRKNTTLQDFLIGEGIKIFFAQSAREVEVENGVISDASHDEVSLKEVSVEDLLPREEIKVNLKSVAELLTGRRVLITGSAGSIGSEIVRQVAAFKPAAMMLIDQAETPQHDIRLMMARDFPEIPAETVVTSISRKTRMEYIFSSFKPDYVFHAAAYKHVPMMEDNPSEAVINNVYGTKVIADLSVKYGVQKFVMISTDKAVNPTNVMGCSKRICEIYVQSLSMAQKTTQFVTTRFGNVLGSNGSVIPLFREQIKNGGPVTVTHPDIIRYFMLIPEACKLVLEAGTKGNGGEIFVFDMGEPVRIADLAKRMIALSGAKNVKVEFTGLREGEKLYEEVLNELEGTKPTFHDKIRIAEVRQYDYGEVCKEIDGLIETSRQYDNMATVRKMKEIVPEYKSNNSVYELLDK